MNVFLVLSGSAVAFYLFILLALWRDNRKRRNGRIVIYSSSGFNEIWGFEADSTDPAPHSEGRRFSNDVLWLPVTKLHMGGARRPVEQPPKLVSPAASKTSAH